MLPRVLLMQDHPDGAGSLRWLLSLGGYGVRVAHSGREGITYFVLDVCLVRVGDFTLFGPEVQICTVMHP